jgi:hypothetical protein
MYGVLYAVSPELFPSPQRGTGNALVAVANRVFGIMVSNPGPCSFCYAFGTLHARTNPVFIIGSDCCALRRPYVERAHFH